MSTNAVTVATRLGFYKAVGFESNLPRYTTTVEGRPSCNNSSKLLLPAVRQQGKEGVLVFGCHGKERRVACS